jgi:hypothetical protein
MIDIKSLFSNSKFIDLAKNVIPAGVKEINEMHRQNGKLPPEVGKTREYFLVSILSMVQEDLNFINLEVDAMEKEIDLYLFSRPVSVKTVSPTSSGEGNPPKLNWASGVENGENFKREYKPYYDILSLRITTKLGKKKGCKGLSYIFRETQEEIFNTLGVDKYLSDMHKINGDNKGTTLSNEANWQLLEHPSTLSIDIDFLQEEDKPKTNYQIEYWKKWITGYSLASKAQTPSLVWSCESVSAPASS